MRKHIQGRRLESVAGKANTPVAKILPMKAKASSSRSNATKSAAGLLPVRSAVAHTGIASSLRYIYKNYDRPIKVMELGSIAGLSRRGYFKAFQRHVGLRPAQVLRHLRIERAKQLLWENKLPLSEIAPQCGYPLINSFWVAFRQTTGLSPGQFQRQTRPADKSAPF
jgi:transcriptional regulator GlxA family with amidase domain